MGEKKPIVLREQLQTQTLSFKCYSTKWLNDSW